MANWLNQLQSLLGQQGRSSSSDDQSSGKNLLLPGALGGLAGLLVASKSSRKLLAKYGTGALLVGGGALAFIPGLPEISLDPELVLVLFLPPLLFLLGVEDIVYWARELGGSKTSTYAYPHGDWRLWYFLALLVFYLLMTRLSEIALGKLYRRLARGQATAAGEAMRKAAA